MMPTRIDQAAREIFNQQGQKIGTMLAAYYLPQSKLETILEYAISMQAKNPHMKQERIVRKTVEYFKLKLKTDG